MAPSNSPSQQTSIWNRKRDLYSVAFLASAVFFALSLDLVSILPLSPKSPLSVLYTYMLENLKDPLYISGHPPYLKAMIVFELAYCVPFSIWGIRGLLRGDQTVAAHLLVVATDLVITTAICLAELMATKNYPQEYIDKCIPGYVGFLLGAVGLWVDMFARVTNGLNEKTKFE